LDFDVRVAVEGHRGHHPGPLASLARHRVRLEAIKASNAPCSDPALEQVDAGAVISALARQRQRKQRSILED